MFQELNKRIQESRAKVKENSNIGAALLVGVMVISMASPHLMAASTKETVIAKVISSKPIMKSARVFEDQEVCDEVRRKIATKGETQGGGVVENIASVAGGILGGVLGHQIGGGMGKNVATVGGAILGTLGGNAVAKANTSDKNVYEISEECHTEKVQKTIMVTDGYDIEARLPNGQSIFGKVKTLSDEIEVIQETSYKIK